MIFEKYENEAFNMWAFGEKNVYFSPYDNNYLDIMNMWNRRHSDLLKLEPEGSLGEDLSKMWDIWEKHGKTQRHSWPT